MKAQAPIVTPGNGGLRSPAAKAVTRVVATVFVKAKTDFEDQIEGACDGIHFEE